MQASVLKNKLEFARFTHLLVVYVIALSIYLFSIIPHKWWVLLTVLVVTAGIEPGLILKRARHRVLGTLLALIFMIPLLYLLQLNYRLVPVVFIVSLIAMNVTALNPARYDITVFFITIVVFFLLIQTVDKITPEGPIEMVLNRGICTLIGIGIVIFSDYVLFQAYQYSRKLYVFHQMMIIEFLRQSGQEIQRARDEGVNHVIFIERLRNDFIQHFAPIISSAENLQADLKTNQTVKNQVKDFQHLIWDIRRLVFALCFSELVLKTPEASKKHWQQYDVLMKEAEGAIFHKTLQGS